MELGYEEVHPRLSTPAVRVRGQRKPVENNLKNKTLRKALCKRGEQVFVAVSRDDIAINDIAQMLSDLDVNVALYLIGGKGAFGWAFDADGECEQFGNEDMRPEYRNESYILWK